MPPGIVIIGLGPGDPRCLTRAAWETLKSAKEVHLRTSQHPIREHLPSDLRVTAHDRDYESQTDLIRIYESIVEGVLHAGRKQDGVVYAVPGDPCVGELTVAMLREKAALEGLPVTVVHGVSFIEPCLDLLGQDGMNRLTVMDALDLSSGHHPQVMTHSAVLVGQLYSRMLASDVKLTLLNAYPEEHEVSLVHNAGLPSGFIEDLRLHEIDTSPNIGARTALFLPPLHEYSAFAWLQETVAHLRAPEGCPWDREQTHQTLRQHLLEEAYEAIHAIDQGDLSALEEELGDLLLQVVLQTQIATEAEAFQMADVIGGVNDKLVRRHPHVFGDLQVKDVEQVLHNWEALKASEHSLRDDSYSVLSGVPTALPALALSNEYQSRAARVGFDWDSVEGVRAKVIEELDELESAPSEEERFEEFGDLLFSLVNLARWKEIDPESALRVAADKFRNRFERLEAYARDRDLDLHGMGIDELELLWSEAKGTAR